jgi:oxygen-independent coproporphyrinogen-3 oxidase
VLSFPNDGNLSLYLHIPFCTTCCSYCAFYSEPVDATKAYLQPYVDRLEQEIRACKARLDRFFTIFIGGGNPGSLPADQLRRLLVAAKADASDEVTIEMNPETFDETYFSLFAEGLVTRLSMGIQSMDDPTLMRLGRNARREDNLRSIALARQARLLYGIELSFDLMVCLPGQTVDLAIADLHEILMLSESDHISLYCLTVEEGTELALQVGLGNTTVLDEDGQEDFLQKMWSELRRLGFEHYEVSNFCRNGKKSKHNQVYWRLDNYLGLGSSAASTLKEGSLARHYTQNQSLQEFASSQCFSGYEEEHVDANQQIEEYVMMALRTNAGIDKQVFAARYQKDFDCLFASAISSLDSSWYSDTIQFFVLTEYGFMVIDEILLRLALEIS